MPVLPLKPGLGLACPIVLQSSPLSPPWQVAMQSKEGQGLWGSVPQIWGLQWRWYDEDLSAMFSHCLAHRTPVGTSS